MRDRVYFRALCCLTVYSRASYCLPVPIPERFTKVLSEQQQDRARREQERIRLLTADPFDLDAQAKIEEDIR